MKRIIHPAPTQEQVDSFLAKKQERGGSIECKSISDISIDSLLGDGLLSLYREVKNLLFLSTKGKLNKDDSRDLRDIIKLLFELKDREKALLEGLNNEELLNSIEENKDVD